MTPMPPLGGMPQIPAQKPRACGCSICRTSRGIKALRKALDDVDAGTDGLVEHGGEVELAFAWLRDEVEAVIAQRRSWLVRRRLRKALDVARWPDFPTTHNGGVQA